MFFILGVSQSQKKLDYKELNICKCCGKYSIKVCSVCEYKTEKDFTYCPKCSNKL